MTVEITPELLASIPYEMLASELGRRNAALRDPSKAGRPPKMEPCPVCKKLLSSVERRKHSPNWCRIDRASKRAKQRKGKP